MPLVSIVFQLSVTGLLMALPVLLLRPLIRRTLPYLSMWVLWVVVLAVSLIPMGFSSPLSITKAMSTSSPTQVIQNTLSYDTSYNPMEEGRNMGITPLVYLLTIAWIPGTYTMLHKFFYNRLDLYKRFKSATLLKSARYQKYVSGFRRQVRIYTSHSLGAPVTYGILRPKIILPYTLLQADEKTIGHVLLHEAEHIRHFDSLLSMVWLILLSIQWFNPFLWLCWIFFRKDIEVLCDIRVIRKLGLSHRADYARTILSLTPVRSSFSSALSISSCSAKDRITRIMRYRTPTTQSWCALLLLLCVLLTVFVP